MYVTGKGSGQNSHNLEVFFIYSQQLVKKYIRLNLAVHFQRIWPKSQLLGPHDGFKLQSSLLLHSAENWIKGLLKKEKKLLT